MPSDERWYACTVLPAVALVIVKTVDGGGGGAGAGAGGVLATELPAVPELLLPPQAASNSASAIQDRNLRFLIPRSLSISATKFEPYRTVCAAWVQTTPPR